MWGQIKKSFIWSPSLLRVKKKKKKADRAGSDNFYATTQVAGRKNMHAHTQPPFSVYKRAELRLEHTSAWPCLDPRSPFSTIGDMVELIMCCIVSRSSEGEETIWNSLHIKRIHLCMRNLLHWCNSFAKKSATIWWIKITRMQLKQNASHYLQYLSRRNWEKHYFLVPSRIKGVNSVFTCLESRFL